ncbi:MAG: hypothetical protein JWM16_6186, partial [Verrucomicrobiales bacterium]|nr:hypothetical protein [Verrucomicrobiales bacterium]
GRFGICPKHSDRIRNTILENKRLLAFIAMVQSEKVPDYPEYEHTLELELRRLRREPTDVVRDAVGPDCLDGLSVFGVNRYHPIGPKSKLLDDLAQRSAFVFWLRRVGRWPDDHDCGHKQKKHESGDGELAAAHGRVSVAALVLQRKHGGIGD